MKKGGLRLLMAFFCALLVGILGFGSTDVSAAMPGSVDAPKNVTPPTGLIPYHTVIFPRTMIT